MMDPWSRHHRLFLLSILVLLSQARLSRSWSPFSWGKGEARSSEKAVHGNAASEFSMEAFNGHKGIQLVEKAKNKMLSTDDSSCWKTAYKGVFDGCSKTLADEELRSRLAWGLSDCFQHHTARAPFPFCDPKSKMRNCLKKLDGNGVKIYLEYYLETNSICHQLQAEAFRDQTERLVNELKSTAEYAEAKLGKIEEHGELLLKNAKDVVDSLASIDVRTQLVAEKSKVLEEHMVSSLRYSEVVYEHAKGIASSQLELREGQVKMKESLAQGMALVETSYENLGGEVVKLRDEAREIEREIGKVGDAMSSKMRVLQSKADDIGNISGTSLDKQRELLEGQSVALEGLDYLTKFQSQALEESRLTMQKLAEFGHKLQEELLKKQKQILASQVAFESKQASMFHLLNAMQFESGFVYAFVVYSGAIFVVYMLTSIKQTYNVRPNLYLGLLVTFLIEISIFWSVTTDGERRVKLIYIVRTLFGGSTFLQYVYAFFTYRDYEVLNHEMLVKLAETVSSMQRRLEMVAWEAEDEVKDWRSWVDTELTEDVQLLEDPDYVLPQEVAESCPVTTSHTKRYNLRRRS